MRKSSDAADMVAADCRLQAVDSDYGLGTAPDSQKLLSLLKLEVRAYGSWVAVVVMAAWDWSHASRRETAERPVSLGGWLLLAMAAVVEAANGRRHRTIHEMRQAGSNLACRVRVY